MNSANEMEGITQPVGIQRPPSRGMELTTYSFAQGCLPGLVPSQEVTEAPASSSMEGYFSFSTALAQNSPFGFANGPPGYAFPPPASTSTWNFAIQPAVVPALPTDFSGGRFSTGGFSAASSMDFEVDPNRIFGGVFVDPYSPKKKAVSTFTEPGNSNQMEDFPEIRQELKEARKPPSYADYICDICKNSTVAKYGRHWIQQCPLKNSNPNTPYQGDRRSKGQFKCSCGHSFFSENVYANEKKLCKVCKRLIAPKKMWAHEKPWDYIPHGIPDYKNPHNQ